MAMEASRDLEWFLVMGDQGCCCDTAGPDGWPCAQMYILGKGARSSYKFWTGTLLV